MRLSQNFHNICLQVNYQKNAVFQHSSDTAENFIDSDSNQSVNNSDEEDFNFQVMQLNIIMYNYKVNNK